jgi:hypothetical protein
VSEKGRRLASEFDFARRLEAMGKVFGVVLAIIALVSAYPIVTHMYAQPVDISTHGHAIDEHLSDTMAEAGISFLGAQLLSGLFCLEILKSQSRVPRSPKSPTAPNGWWPPLSFSLARRS